MSFEGVSDVLDHPGVETDSVTLASPTTHHKEAALEATPSHRPQAATPVDSHSLEYRMNHKRRGLALIIVYEEYGGSCPVVCRGEETDKGIQLNKQKGLRVSTDSFDPREKEDYVIPIHADMLMMWASYPG
ncbi:hypothetical protein Pmani_023610 [Petrolisthes manimaculis]|uniref:Uncharacterized protein n=1 Tax=Petrolisthes manimaculis TaxID=1843537 RepID=A0AAE1P9P0_9EUCA|nr:hypothetical protein Pmani_023610 [Petrolisthes manimaculis]